MGFSTGGGGARAPLSDINVTPLVDVMLVLLIIFMVAAPMLSAGISVDLPKTQADRMPQDEEKLLLTITREREIYVGETLVPYDRLEQSLKTNARVQRDKEVFVQADKDVSYGFAASVFALIRRAGVTKLGLVTDPLGSEEGDAP